jgi:alpha-L-rhamnosidase
MMNLDLLKHGMVVCFVILGYIMSNAVLADSSLSVEQLRCEYKTDPLGIDVLHPRLSWQVVSADRGVKQTAYQIRAAKTRDQLEKNQDLLWNTGRIDSDQSIHVIYKGKDLRSGQRVYWQVRVWDNKGNQTLWSQPQFWEMGLLDAGDWQANWIQPNIPWEVDEPNPCPMLRHEFTIDKPIKFARAYITSLGLYEAHLNGKKIGNQVLTPGWTSYDHRLQYQTYDITSQLQTGENALGVYLGNGWYRGNIGWVKARNVYGNTLALLLQIKVTFKDGSQKVIGSNESWKSTTGPILMSEIYHGETYDARLEKQGWSEPGFDESNWSDVSIINHPTDILIAPQGPPIKRIEEIQPIDVFTTPDGDTVVDMGQNMVGWIRLKVQGKPGSTVTLKHAEVLDKYGNFYVENLRSAKQTIRYTLKGAGVEIFEPHFTFQGFRYVKVEGFPGEPDPENLTGVVVHSDIQPTGHFKCSDAMINQLQHNIKWGQKGNFVDVPTDCPQRDERLGWTGDAQVFARTASFNFDVAAFYTKWIKDLTADQKESGAIPNVIPDVLDKGDPVGRGGRTGWADAGIIVPWTVYLYYGDKRLLEQEYDMMKAWIGYMKKQAGDRFIWDTGEHYGDWLAFNTTRSDYPGATTDKDLLATAYFAYSTSLMKKIATLLGKTKDAELYDLLFENIKDAFQEEYVTPNARLSSNTQTAYSIALAFDLIENMQEKKAAGRLADDVKKFGHITTGFLGTPLISHVLSDYGYLDLAFMLLNRKEYPSWLYPITMGATTIWERWDGIKPDSTFQNAGMNSFNHYAYGAIGDWLYRVVAGIQLDEENPGFKHVVIHPHPGGGLTFVQASIESMYGKVLSDWTIQSDKFNLTVEIPANSSATVILPDAKQDEVWSDEKALTDVEGITAIRQQGENVVVSLGSGTYSFSYKQN